MQPEIKTLIREIVARLRPLETERVRLRHETIRNLVILACGTALVILVIPIAFAILLPWDEAVPWREAFVGRIQLMVFVTLVLVAPVAVSAAGVFAARWMGRVHEGWERRVVDAVVPLICDAFGGIQYQPKIPHLDFVAPFEKLGVVDSSTDQELAHYFCGIYRDTRFEFVHANLYKPEIRRRKLEIPLGTRLDFTGLLFRIQMPINVVEPIIISPENEWHDLLMRFRRPSDMPRVSLGYPPFDEKFRVSFRYETSYSKGEALIRDIVTPDLQHALLNLYERESTLARGRVSFNAGLMYDSLYLALSRRAAYRNISIHEHDPRPFLRLPFYLRAQSGLEQAVQAMLDDVLTVYRVIDRLHGQAPVDDGR